MEKKKLVFILNNFLIGGTERILLEILKNLDRSKFEVNIITVFGSGSLEPEFRKLKFPIFFAGPKKYHSSLLFKVIWILSTPFILLRLIVFLRKIKPDIIITSLYEADILGIFSSWLLGIKKRIIIYHDVHKMSVIRRVFRKIFSLNLANRVIAVAVTVKEFLIHYWRLPEHKIIVIPNSIDFRKFEIEKKPLGINLVIGFIGRFVLEKDPYCLLKSLVILKKKHGLEPKAIMVGGGRLESDLKQFVSDNNLNNIQFVGWVNNVIDLLRKIDILVVPSIEEGSALVILEGLVSNKIVVASDIESIKELIHSGKNGILFKVGDANSLSKKLKDLLTDSALIKSYYDNVSEWINKNKYSFNIKYTSKRYSEIFEN